MLNNNDYKVGALITLKKPHPSGTIVWEVMKNGIEIKLKSTTIKDLYIFVDRIKFNKFATIAK